MTIKKNGVIILGLSIIFFIWINYNSDSLEDKVKKAIVSVYLQENTQNFFTYEHYQRLIVYFSDLEDNGFLNPKFSTFKPEDENVIYVLIQSEHPESNGQGFGYLVITLDSNSKPSELMLSNRVRIANDKPNF